MIYYSVERVKTGADPLRIQNDAQCVPVTDSVVTMATVVKTSESTVRDSTDSTTHYPLGSRHFTHTMISSVNHLERSRI